MKRAITAVKNFWTRVVALSTLVISRFEALPRPAQMLIVIGTVLTISLSIDANHGWRVWNQLFKPDISTVAKVRFWSALVYNLVLAMGLPVAFLVWHWRDKNARDQIEQQRLQVEQQRHQVENSRKDINLKEFQEVQGRAAGLFDEKMPESAREQLQIAALHQLRAFLRGEYGDAFRRPAFELILAGHAEAMDRIGTRDAKQQILNMGSNRDPFLIVKLQKSLNEKLDRVMRERIFIMKDESKAIFHSGFPLNDRIFDLCDFSNVAFSYKTDLHGSSFVFSKMTNAKLNGANLQYSILFGSNLNMINMIGSNLNSADFGNSQLNDASLQHSNLDRAFLDGSTMMRVRLEGAIISSVNMKNVILHGAYFNDKTEFIKSENNVSSQEIKSAQDDFRKRGARHVNDFP